MEKILVFGAGPIGSFFAARLQEAGKDVTLLARGKRLEDLKRIVYWIPEPLMVALLRKILVKEKLKSSVEGHINGGLDELKHLTYEIMPLIRKSGVQTPSIDRLLPYYEGKGPEIPEGSRNIPMKWGGVVLPLIIIAALIGLLIIH
jgi:hypothetical protein